MKYTGRIIAILFVLLMAHGLSYAGASVENGKKLFNDPTLGGSTNSKSCNTCHYNGSGLEQAGTKKYSRFMNMTVISLEDVVNVCIEKPLRGKALDKDSQEMKDIVSYIKSLGKK